MFACLSSGSRAEGLVFWSQIHHLLLQQWGGEKKNLQALAKHSAFEKLPLARNQQGAVRNLVAKPSEDPDHMGCAVFQSTGRWAGLFPYVLIQSRQRAGLWAESLSSCFSGWREMVAKNSGRKEPRKGRERVQKSLCRRKWDWELLGQEQSQQWRWRWDADSWKISK